MNEFYAMLVQKDCVVALFCPGGAQYGLSFLPFCAGCVVGVATRAAGTYLRTPPLPLG